MQPQMVMLFFSFKPDHQACQQRVLPTEPLSQPKVVYFFNQMILVHSEKDKKVVMIKVPISDYMNVWE